MSIDTKIKYKDITEDAYDVGSTFVNIDYEPKPVASKLFKFIMSLRYWPHRMNRLMSLKYINRFKRK